MTTKTKRSPKTASKAKTGKKPIATKRLQPKKSGAEGKDTKEKAKVGRPTSKTPEILKTICEGISLGKSARSMCDEVGISQFSLWNWLDADPEFSKQYARAKELSADVYAAKTQEVAEELPDGALEPSVFNARQRLRYDAVKWYASKLAPKKYGDKLDMNHGIQPDNPLADLMGKIVGSDTGRIRPAS